MTEDFQRIRRLVRRLVRRERLLLVVRVILQGSLVLLGALAVAVLAASLSWERPRSAFLVVLLTGVGSWWAVVWPLVRRWARAGDHLAQARRVEALQPELRGRLLTVVERTEGARSGESEAMVALVARRVAAAIEPIAVEAVHPSRRIARLGGAAALGWALLLPATLLAPGGPRGVMSWWLAGGMAEAAMATLALPGRQDFATVGDLTVRYVYPAYTGLDPKEVPNSTGDVRGPPGTQVEVRARTADTVEAAGMVAYDERLEAEVGQEGRQVSGRFAVGAESGFYHLLLYRGAEPERSRDFAVEPEPDLAPEVMLESESDTIRIAVDMDFDLRWRARDDYGISRVQLQLGGESRPDPLFVAERRQAEAYGIVRTSPRQLGLKPGDTVELTVAAWDNDTVSGRKAGYSRPIQVVVLGARGLQERVAARHGELLEVLVPILAAQLTDPWPPADTSGEMARWGEQVSRRYEPLHDAVERLWRGMDGDTYDARMIRSVLESGTKLVRYTQVAFTPRSVEIPSDDAYQATAEMRERSISTLEDAVLFLLDMQHLRALAEATRHARSISQAARTMQEMLEDEDADAQQMLSMLDQIERMLARLAEQAEQLGEGGLKEFLNQRQTEVQRLMDEVREALARGDLERARELMERLARQLSDMAQGMQDELQRREQQGDDLMAELEAVDEALEALEQEQRQVQAEVQELREQADQEASQEARSVWEQVERRSREVLDDGARYEREVGGGESERGRPFAFNEQQRAKAALEELQSLYEAAVARDLRGARRAVFEADTGWMYAHRAAEVRAGRGAGGPPPQDIARIRGKLREISDLLDQLDRLSQHTDPETRDKAQRLEQQQQELDKRLEQVSQQARQLEQRLPVRPEGMREALDDAGQRMEQAAEDLGQGQLMQAEGSQGSAAERVRDAREALEQARQQMQEQAQQMQGGQGQEQGERQENGDDQRSEPPTAVEIPGREEFRTPEEYRRALLEGMEGEVPEEYRALKKRYFEELVHQ